MKLLNTRSPSVEWSRPGAGGTGHLERIDGDIGPRGGIEDGHFGLAAHGVSHRPTRAVMP